MFTSDKFEDFLDIQSRYHRKISNDFMVPAEIKKRFERGMLSFSADERALFMFEQREGFFKLYFRLIDDGAKLPPHDGTLASFLTYREGRYPEAAADWLRGQGFDYSKTLRRHTASRIIGEISNDGVVNAPADEVYSMLGVCFSVVEADLPPRELFVEADSYCMRSPSGDLLGIVYDMGHTRIVAVSQEARGQGLGRRLYLAYASGKMKENKDIVFHEWVSLENTASQSMFRAMGFEPGITLSDCFVFGGSHPNS